MSNKKQFRLWSQSHIDNIRFKRRSSYKFIWEKRKKLILIQQIDSVVEEGRWDLDDVFKDTDIKKADTFDRVVYNMAGYSNV